MHLTVVPHPDEPFEDARLQFALQLYEDCLEKFGADHAETRLMARYIAICESSKRVFSREAPCLSPPAPLE
jgi:hypothetical protein